VRANVIRADCEGHLSVPESLEEALEDVWALISNCDSGIALCKNRFDTRQLCPVTIFILIDEELSLDREWHLCVYVKLAHSGRSICTISILDSDSALALSGFRAGAR